MWKFSVHFHLILSNSCPIAIMINFFFRVSRLFIRADTEEALCFQAEDYSVHLKMDFKAVPIQLTVGLCQPSVLQTQSNPLA